MRIDPALAEIELKRVGSRHIISGEIRDIHDRVIFLVGR